MVNLGAERWRCRTRTQTNKQKKKKLFFLPCKKKKRKIKGGRNVSRYLWKLSFLVWSWSCWTLGDLCAQETNKQKKKKTQQEKKSSKTDSNVNYLQKIQTVTVYTRRREKKKDKATTGTGEGGRMPLEKYTVWQVFTCIYKVHWETTRTKRKRRKKLSKQRKCLPLCEAQVNKSSPFFPPAAAISTFLPSCLFKNFAVQVTVVWGRGKQ